MAHADAVAEAYLADRPEWQAVGRRYLHENLMFELTPRAVDGLRLFYREATALGLAACETQWWSSSAGRIWSHERQ